jgi:hypothetical protein
MKKPLFFLLVFVLTACGNSIQALTPGAELSTPSQVVILPIAAPTKRLLPAPTSPVSTATPEPDIQLTMVSEQNYSSGLVEWFPDGSQFAILSQGQLEVFDTKT